MKFRISCLAVCLVLAFSSQTIKAQGGSCNLDHNVVPCVWGSWSTNIGFWVTYSFGYCAPCSVKVYFNYRTCTGSGTIYEQYQMVAFDHPTCPCASNYLDSLRSANPSGYDHLMTTWWMDLNSLLYDGVFTATYYSGGDTNYYACDQMAPSCHSSGWNNHYMLAVYSSCVEYIDVGNIIPPIGPGCPGMTYIAQCDCEGCCMFSRQYCWDQTTHQPRKCDSWTRLLGGSNESCTGNATSTPPIGCDIIHRSGCLPTLCNTQ